MLFTEDLDALIATGWLEEKTPGLVPRDGKFGFILKDGAPSDVKEKFEYWRDLVEWEHENMVMGATKHDIDS